MVTRQPAIFMSHGGGPAFFMDAKGSIFNDIDMNSTPKKFFENLSSLLPQKPRAIVIASAHWEESEFTVGYQDKGVSLIYDYYGFPKDTYAPYLTYDAPTDLSIADDVFKRLHQSGLSCHKVNRGFDHGVFLPLKLAFPEGDIPIIQVSLISSLDPAAHVAMGKALAPLRDDNILLIGSGSMTHNLGELRAKNNRNNSSAVSWAFEFNEWTRSLLESLTDTNKETVEDDLIHIMERAPYAARSHPRTEHLVPLFVAFGAGLCSSDGVTGVKCKRVFDYRGMGIMSLDTYLFE